MLTKRQELFTQNLYKGLSQRKAYLEAGYSNKGKVTSIDEMACVVANSLKVVTRLAELNEPNVERARATKDSKLKKLEEIFNKEPLLEISTRDRLQAIAEHNKMEHIYEPGGNIRDVNVVFVIGIGYKESRDATE